MTRLIKSALIALAASLAFAPASLADQHVTRHVKVDYSDLDLSNAAGAQTLMRRLVMGADKACGGRPHHGSARPFKRDFQTCSSGALAEAVSELDAPTVTALFMRRNAPVKLASR